MSEQSKTPSEWELVAKAIAEEFMEDLRRGLKKKFARKREGVHMSDLCPRQIVFRDIHPEVEMSFTDVNNFTSGAAIGAALESISEEHKDKYSTEAFTNMGHFINGHIDVFNKQKNIPVEFKTYRSGSTDKLPKWHQLDQLMSYMTGQNAEYGILLYQLLMRFDDGVFAIEQPVPGVVNVDKPWKSGLIMLEFGPFVAYVKRMSPEERIAHSKNKVEVGLQQVKARAYGQPALAPHVMDNPELTWLCRKCPWLEECRTINAGAELK